MMLKLFFHIFFIINSFFIVSYEDKKLLSGAIEFPQHMDYDICLFYKGEKLSTVNQKQRSIVEYSFLDQKNIYTMYLVITNSVECLPECSNTLECLSVVQNQTYICYKFQARREYDENNILQLTWDVQEYILENDFIPYNSLIFLFEPRYILGLKIHNWKSENVFRIMPTIIIKPLISVEEIERAMIIARFAALDIDALHSKKKILSSDSTLATLVALQ